MKIIDYSIKNTIVIRFIVALLIIGGLFSYFKLGKLEDPEFKIKEALVVTLYPGASQHDTELFVTDKIEQALQKIPNIEFTESVSKNGYSQVKIKLKESVKSKELPQYWDNVRKKINDAQINLPQGVIPSIVLDDYGDVYGMFLAVTSDGYSYSELSKYTKYIEKELQSIPGVSKTSIFGNPKENVEILIDRNKINSMGISTKAIAMSLFSQNLITGGGNIDYGNLIVNLKFNNEIKTMEKLKNLIIFSGKLPNGNSEIIRLGDIATIKKGYSYPMKEKMYYNGKKSMGISLSPLVGTNIVNTGKEIDAKIDYLKEKLPLGISVEKIYYQPDLVSSSINIFVINLLISIFTVVGVLLLTMGLKSGFIIGSGLILSILGTLIAMLFMKIDLQRVSLGSFIIAMGMLVDNSIVIVDNTLVNLNKNLGIEVSLENATKKPAIPLLGATLIAVLAFLPAYLMPTYMGEYVGSCFWVIGISLILSWALCLTQTPAYCKVFLTKKDLKKPSKKEIKFYDKARKTLELLIKYKKITITIVFCSLLFSIFLLAFIPKSFFPDSNKKGFTVNLWCPEGTKIKVIEDASLKLNNFLMEDKRIKNVTATIGASPARYYVSTIPEAPNSSFGELIVSIKKLKELDKIASSILNFSNKNLPGVMVSIKKYPNGTAVEYPIEYEFSGPDPKILRDLSQKAITIMKNTPGALNVRTNWRNKVLTWKGDFSQINAKKVAITPFDVTTSLIRSSNGMPIGKIKDEDSLKAVVLKEKQYGELSNIEKTPIWGLIGKAQPLGSIIKNSRLEFENNQIWRKNRIRTIKVQCDVPIGTNPDKIRNLMKKDIENITLPKDYSAHWGGLFFEQMKNTKALVNSVPFPVVIMFTICVLLFASVKIAGLIFLMIPLALIGIAPGLLITGKSFGFMSAVGLIALSGIMIKNIVVLMDEINFQINGLKKEPEIAVIDSSVSRIRAVGLAAVTTIFGMIPLLRDPLYGDMAATIIFGLFASTILTLFIFPVLYLITYRK
ncbi:MAG: efflux RND transporter permease subunit [Fusobacterium sp. JB019]|nr:efflux RND transporter permease subunit [Fusobacterium sp. JB019]